jgi:SAM-dependent methyltransferase
MHGPESYADETGAEFYDIAFDWRRDEEADFAEACVERFGARNVGALLDLACGGGQFLAEMQQREWRVAGVDISPHMVERARGRLGGEYTLEVACMSRFRLRGSFDIATCWLDSVTYLLTNEDIIRHLQRVARVLTAGGLYLLDLGFGRWADPMWREPEADWRPDFSNGWSASRGNVGVYHDGCDGPPCDPLLHTCTEYMYFRATDRDTGAVTERTYTARKRALHPQELAALACASEAFEVAEWLSGSFDLGKRLDSTAAAERGLVVLRKRP